MLKQDGTLCSFSPCIKQVQRSCETLRSDFTDIWTFEMLLNMYEIREWKMDHSKVNDGNSTTCPPRKRRQSKCGGQCKFSDSHGLAICRNLRAYQIFDIRKEVFLEKKKILTSCNQFKH